MVSHTHLSLVYYNELNIPQKSTYYYNILSRNVVFDYIIFLNVIIWQIVEIKIPIDILNKPVVYYHNLLLSFGGSSSSINRLWMA